MNRSLVDAAKALPPTERLELIDELWASLTAEHHEPELTPAQAEELDRRWEDHLKNPDATHTWAEVEAALTKRFSRKQ